MRCRSPQSVSRETLPTTLCQVAMASTQKAHALLLTKTVTLIGWQIVLLGCEKELWCRVSRLPPQELLSLPWMAFA